jgi:aminopeptidase YwaD
VLSRTRPLVVFVLLLSLLSTGSAANKTKKAPAAKKPAAAADPLTDTQHVCARCLRSTLEFLAADALRGRGSATPDERVAATYVGTQLAQYGVPPAFSTDNAEKNGYVQTATLETPQLAAPPTLSFTASVGAAPVTWTHGKQFFLSRSSGKSASGPLQKLPKEGGKANPGAIVYWAVDANSDPRTWFRQVFALLQSGAAAVLIPSSDQNLKNWDSLAKERPLFEREVVGEAPSAMSGGIRRDFVVLKPEAAQQIGALAEGTLIKLETKLGEPKREYTYNAVGIIHGTEPNADKDAILLTAHLDHLGAGAPANGAPPSKDDNIYNGACDDASGTATVLEFARAIAAGPKPKRTVVFALFGSEELGGLGSTYFLSHSPIPLADYTANLEFEMLAWPDPKLKPDVLWMTGFDRSDFGPELAKHGANLVADPYPEQNFFQRSDNFVLAKKGVVAQTIGSFGLQKEYHSPQDDLAHVDWTHYTKAVDSLIAPVQWLVNGDFKPQWLPGKKP